MENSIERNNTDYVDLIIKTGLSAIWGGAAGLFVSYSFKVDPVTAIGSGVLLASGFTLQRLIGSNGGEKVNWASVSDVFKYRNKKIKKFDVAPVMAQVPQIKNSPLVSLAVYDRSGCHVTYRQYFDGFTEEQLYKIGFYVHFFGNYKISKDFLKDKSKLMTAGMIRSFQCSLVEREFAEKNDKGREGREGFKLTETGKQLMLALSKNYYPTPSERLILRNLGKNRGTSLVQPRSSLGGPEESREE